MPTCGSAECNSPDGIHGRCECPLLAGQLKRVEPFVSDLSKCCQIYQVVAPLRLLLARASDPAACRTLDRLVSHYDRRRQMAMYERMDQSVVAVMKQLLRVEQFDTEAIRTACGILDTNSFEVRMSGKSKMRALYPTVSLMNHNCRPNTRHSFDQQMNMSVWAVTDIAPGQAISATYTQILWPTSIRWGLS